MFLGGFSQGGAVILPAGRRRSEPVAGLIALSTYVPAAPKAAAALADGANAQPVFLGHGTQDPVVPFRAGEQTQALLRALGFTVDWHAYPTPPSVCLEAIRDLGHWLGPRLEWG